MSRDLHKIGEQYRKAVADEEVEKVEKAVLRMMGLPDDPGLQEHTRHLLRALSLHAEREQERQGVWRRSGLRGQVFHLFAKAERAFSEVMRGDVVNDDHFYDAINYATFALRLPHEGDRNGDWPWEG